MNAEQAPLVSKKEGNQEGKRSVTGVKSQSLYQSGARGPRNGRKFHP